MLWQLQASVYAERALDGRAVGVPGRGGGAARGVVAGEFAGVSGGEEAVGGDGCGVFGEDLRSVVSRWVVWSNIPGDVCWREVCDGAGVALQFVMGRVTARVRS